MEVIDSKESKYSEKKPNESTYSNKICEIDYVDDESKKVIEYSWKKQFDTKFKGRCKPFTIPRLKHIIPFLPLSIRYIYKNK